MMPGHQGLGEKEFEMVKKICAAHAPAFKAQVALAALRQDKRSR